MIKSGNYISMRGVKTKTPRIEIEYNRKEREKEIRFGLLNANKHWTRLEHELTGINENNNMVV